MNSKDIISDLINQLAQARHDEIEKLELGKNCTTCDQFDITKEFCTLYKARPPVKVIVAACNEYSADVPF